MNLTERIVELSQAGYAGVFVVSHEERRVRHDVAEAIKAPKLKDWTYCHWDTATGITNGKQIADRDEVPDIMTFVDIAADRIDKQSIVTVSDLHLHLQSNAQVVQAVRFLLDQFRTTNRVMVGIGPVATLPAELSKDFAVVELDLPGVERLTEIAKGIAEGAGVSDDGAAEAARAARGLTSIEAENAFALSLVREHHLNAAIVQDEKENTIKKNGLVEVVKAGGTLADVGGLNSLKGWLKARRRAFGDEAREFGLPCPKGLLLVGVPGTGKSLAAKATANELGIPLLKADAGRWYGSLVGQSEQNLRSVLEMAEAMAPCVLWLDEIEKGLSGSQSSGSTDGGTSSRVLGTLLSWLQDKTAPVFVVATANNVSALPPETIRKGRFDELFFVDLPTSEEREDIWQIHINRKRKAEGYDLTKLARMTEGYTGAEIEQCWVEAMFSAFDAGRKSPDMSDIAQAVENTVPLSKTAAEQITAVRKWSDGRARAAGGKAAEAEADGNKGRRKVAL